MGKRIFDLLGSILGLAFIWPLLLFTILLIWILDGRPAFFKQERVGRNGRSFKIWKFRTMRMDNAGSKITIAGDDRIYPLGHVLRRYKIDELPQLINVLFGEMSFVGPRPEVQKYVNMYSDEQKKVLDVRPGITDPASLKYFNESEILAKAEDPEKTYIEQIMPDKLKINLEYINRRTMVSDVKIIFETVIGN